MDCKNINGLNIYYRKGTSDDSVISETFDGRIFEKGFPEYKIKKNHLIIDIGAYIGTYSLLLSQSLTEEGIIYAFEPCLDTFQYLEKNVVYNNIKNIKTYRIALSDHIGNEKLYYDVENGNWGHSTIKNFSNAGENVETDTLVNFFERNNIENCDFMKLNCEGAEFKILLNTPVSVLKRIKHMLVLYHLDIANDYTIEQLLTHLKKTGYYTEVRQKSPDGKRGWIIVMQASIFQRVQLTLKSMLRLIYHYIRNATKG